MKKTLIVLGLSVFFMSTFLVSLFAQTDTITVTTYYPSPFGSYRELTWGAFPNTRGELTNDQGSSMEIGGQGTPYIDLSNDMASDFDFRLILTGDDDLEVIGGMVTYRNDDNSPAVGRFGEVWTCSQY